MSSHQQQPQQAAGGPKGQQASKDRDKISFHLKTSIFTRRVTLERDKLALGLVKQLAVAFLNELYFQHPFPAGTYIGDYIRRHLASSDELGRLQERLMLRKYDPADGSLVPFNSVGVIQPESFIVIEVSEKHLLSSHLPAAGSADCMSQQQTSVEPATSQVAGLVSASVTAAGSQLQPSQLPPANSFSSQLSQSSKVRMSHNFKPESFLLPTLCAACSAFIKGVFRQGFQCSVCKRNFCPKCKALAEDNGDSCLSQQSAIGSSIATSAAASTGVLVSGGVQPTSPNQDVAGTGQASQGKLEHANMAKRKSANNLLHFNIANPFKSLHPGNQQQQQPQSAAPDEKLSKARAGSGGLEPVLSKLRPVQAQANQPIQEQEKGNSLLVVQTNQLSSSHQNLCSNSNSRATDESAPPSMIGTPDFNQSPRGSNSRHSNQQISNSARNSAHDLTSLYNLQPGAQQANSVSGHAFICMDWIQLWDEPTCQVCHKTLMGSSRGSQQTPPYMCKNCKAQVHSQCLPLTMADCMDRIAESSRAAAQQQTSDKPADDNQRGPEDVNGKESVANAISNVSKDNIRLHRLAPSVKHVKRPDATKPIIEGWLKHTTLSREQSKRHYWRLDETDITLYENDTSTRYFKAIALDRITRVMSASSLPKRVREDVLMSSELEVSNESDQTGKPAGSKSASASPAKSPELQAQMRAMFAFELSTGSMYLVQASSESEASRWREVLAQATTPINQAKKQPEVKQEEAPESSAGGQKPPTVEVKQVAEPKSVARKVMHERPPNENVRQAPATKGHYHHHHHHHQHRSGQAGQSKTYTDPMRSRLYNRARITIHLDTSFVPKHLIERKYLIEVDPSKGYGFKELGSGQFGKVYAAISEWKLEDKDKGIWSGIPVAIKEISKARFDLRQQEKLKNEANILSRLDHQGVIILERVHDLANEIYIVMEQLEDDMLEMIVSTEDKRLSERVTKFLTYQILEALKYLHSKNIAHCDLKPENVLLVESRSQFPQIKLCDFGFAKIIEENSFRSSLVGTPAYLAPEVVKGERYNRSVDLWSVGVIVYVSLSGEFPFNEGENIHDQISRANFMYPDQPWAKISHQAKSFINSLLRVNCEKRLSANRAQMDDWIQDYQLWCDLSDLELRVGKRWVTDDADYERWSRYAKEHHLQVPRSAVQLHEDLFSE